MYEASLVMQAVLQALSQNRVGKDNAAKEFARTSLLQRTWPRLRSVATLIILSWTIPVSLFGCFLLCTLHLLRGGDLIGIGKVASGRARNKRFHRTVIVSGRQLIRPVAPHSQRGHIACCAYITNCYFTVVTTCTQCHRHKFAYSCVKMVV